MANEFARNIEDTVLTKTGTLPNGAATTYSDVIDLGASPTPPENIELSLAVPAHSTTQAPDTRTLTVTLVAGSTTTPTTAASIATVYTGAAGAGFTGGTTRYRLASDAGRYVRAKFVNGASMGDCSALSGTLKLLT